MWYNIPVKRIRHLPDHMSHRVIKELRSSERPYEKAEKYRVEVLSDADLLAVIIKTGTTEKTSKELAHDIFAHKHVSNLDYGGEILSSHLMTNSTLLPLSSAVITSETSWEVTLAR